MTSLIGHIGRSSAKLRLVKLKENVEDAKEVFMGNYAVAKYPSLDQLIRQFIADARKSAAASHPREAGRKPVTTLSDLCLSFAADERGESGPTPPSLDGLRDAFNLHSAFAVDSTQSFALHDFRAEELLQLNPQAVFGTQGHQLIVNIGESVKACLVLRHEDGFKEALPVEGGYLSIPITSERDFRFQSFCRARLGFERFRSLESSSVVTERGFMLVHEFVCAEAGAQPAGASAAEVLQRYPDPLAASTIAYYAEQLMSAVFNIVIATLPTGGIFIVSDFLLQLLRCVEKDKDLFFGNIVERLILSAHLLEKFAATPVGVTALTDEKCIRGCAEYLTQLYNVQRVSD